MPPDCSPNVSRRRSFAGEIVVVDSGSRDDTVEIARRRGARVLVQPWRGFGAAEEFRRRARPRTTGCFASTPTSASRRSSQPRSGAARRTAPSATAYAVARRNRFLGRWLAHGEGYPDWNVRLFDRRRARWTDDPVHEHVIADGPRRRDSSGDLLHASAESIDDYIAKQNRYTTLQAEAMHARGERASVARLDRLAARRGSCASTSCKLGFLDGVAGFVHIAIGCVRSFLKYAKLRALQMAKPDR